MNTNSNNNFITNNRFATLSIINEENEASMIGLRDNQLSNSLFF